MPMLKLKVSWFLKLWVGSLVVLICPIMIFRKMSRSRGDENLESGKPTLEG